MHLYAYAHMLISSIWKIFKHVLNRPVQKSDKRLFKLEFVDAHAHIITGALDSADLLEVTVAAFKAAG